MLWDSIESGKWWLVRSCQRENGVKGFLIPKDYVDLFIKELIGYRKYYYNNKNLKDNQQNDQLIRE